MRIIAGIAKGTPLVVPRGDNVRPRELRISVGDTEQRGLTRPTSDRVREAVFSSLGDRVIGADVLDMFAGTGALGLEAASRGARSVLFLEHSQAALTALYANIAAFKRHPGTPTVLTVRAVDVFSELARLAQDERVFSLIFADPPYGHTAQRLLDEPMLPSLLAPTLARHGGRASGLAVDGRLVLESAKRDMLVPPPPWRLFREAVYGDTRVSFLSANRVK
jgi:16S rRNA (guanine(966)-N(2))-methyltransferase RsmD